MDSANTNFLLILGGAVGVILILVGYFLQSRKNSDLEEVVAIDYNQMDYNQYDQFVFTYGGYEYTVWPVSEDLDYEAAKEELIAFAEKLASEIPQ